MCYIMLLIYAAYICILNAYSITLVMIGYTLHRYNYHDHSGKTGDTQCSDEEIRA